MIAPVYWVTIHILLLPIRFINAVYFNALFGANIISDGFKELVLPKLDGMRRLQPGRYLGYWFVKLPKRTLRFTLSILGMVVEGVVMCGFDTVWPVFAMWHGTSFEGVGSDIGQKGRWRVGPRDWVGQGLYFGIERRVAENYKNSADDSLILCRVILSYCRPVATLPKRIRQRANAESIGHHVNEYVSWPWCATEHWRPGAKSSWYEYCLLQKKPVGAYVKTWRVRPIAILRGGKIARIWGGIHLWTTNTAGYFMVAFTWVVLFLVYCYAFHIAEWTKAVTSLLFN